jgi:hypothetical protein
MFSAIAAALPIAIGIIFATLPIITIPLILLTRGEMMVLKGFLLGYAAGFIVLGGAVLFMADVIAPGVDRPATWLLWLRVFIGLGLVFLSGVKWNARNSDDEDAAMPGWMKAIESVNSPAAFGLGFVIVVLNPKNALLVASGAFAIASVTYSPLAQIVALVVFTIVSCVGIAAPWLLFLWKGEAAVEPLDRLKGFLARNNAAIIAIVIGLIGTFVTLNAMSYL